MDQEERLKAALADRYRIEQEIGSGGMATVYLAHDQKHDRKVAVKVLNPELTETLGAERFLREIKTAANLTHPHILPLHDSGEASGLLYYVMPYVEGESLRERLNQEEQLSVEDAVQFAREIADALAYAHRQGVIHRDVKPANIMLAEGHAVLADFGVAHAVAEAKDERITRTGTSLGTPAYMSPEQVTGDRELDGRSDQYALGCVLYEMLAGQPPFVATQVEGLVRQHLTADPPDLTHFRPTIPRELRESITRALAKVPADRFATVAEFGRVLRASVKAEEGIGRSARGREKRLGTWVGVGLTGVAAIAAILLLQRRTIDEAPVSPGAVPTWTILAEVEGSAPEEVRDLVGRLLASTIDASGVLLTLPQDQIQRGLSAAFLPDTTPLTRVVASELAERGRISTVLVPSLDRAGATFSLDLRMVEAEKDSVIAVTRVTAENDDALIPASSRVVDSLMVSLADWAGARTRPPRTDLPITASFDAFRKWDRAVTAYRNGDLLEAIALCRQALEIDPQFAEAFIALGNTFEALGFPDSARSAREQALKHPNRLSEDRAAWYAARLAGDPVRQLQVLEQEYQRTGVPTNNLAISLGEMGRYPEALEVFDRIAEQAVFGISQVVSSNWAGYLLAMGRVEEARAVAERTPESSRQQLTMVRVAVRAGDWEEAERLGVEVASDPTMNEGFRSMALRAVASARAARGRVGGAVSALSEMIRLNQDPGREPGRRQALLSLLLLRMAAGLALDPPEVSSLEPDSTALSRVISGLWFAELGDLAVARVYRDGLPLPELGEFDSPTVEQALVATLHARIAFLEDRWMEAARLLKPVTGERLPRSEGSARIPEWVAAEAEERQGYLESAAERLAQVAAGFRFGWGETEAFGLTYSFAHRKAALLYGEGGQGEEAMEHWRAFLEAFTQPDPEFEWMVEEAQAELAQLGG